MTVDSSFLGGTGFSVFKLSWCGKRHPFLPQGVRLLVIATVTFLQASEPPLIFFDDLPLSVFFFLVVVLACIKIIIFGVEDRNFGHLF